jgi:putative DNA primase/helicase
MLEAADNHWPDILTALANVSLDQLTDKHQPCPACGGTDRFRWDRDDGPGGWFCNQCGGKDHAGGAGNGLDLLIRLTGWNLTEATRKVEQHLGLTPLVSAKPSRPVRVPTPPPPDALPPALGNASTQYRYTDAQGQTLFWIQRFDKPDGRKLFVHRTWLDNAWHFPRKADGFDSAWPIPRPLYRLDTLARMPYADVLIVEGEKAADAAAKLLPEFVVLSWPNGSNAIDKIDWSPLAGRFVNLWPDNDKPGRKAMATIASRLSKIGCDCKFVTIPQGSPEGWDVADSVWTPQEALDFVLANRSATIDTPDDSTPHRPDVAQTDAAAPPFDLLGFKGDDYFYLPRSVGAVLRISAAGHSSTTLCRLAPLIYWEAAYPGPRGGVNWTAATSALYEGQHEVGEFDPDLIRGRGAWWDANRSILHLGDRLIVDGAEVPIRIRLKSRYFYQRALPLARMGLVSPLTDEEAFTVLELAEQFYWDRPASALLLAGWCTLAPICGSLPWRPHIWMTAGAGSGKTAVLNRFIAPLLGDLQLVAQGSTTEAFIRQSLKTDALPVVMDEAESNQKADAIRMQQILALARQASSESRAIQGRGSPSGQTTTFRIRSMFLLSSVATAVRCGADDRRFTQLTLRRPPDTDPEVEALRWRDLKARLSNTLTEEFGHRLLARTVQLIPTIRQSISTFCEIAAAHFGSQAIGDQYGVLLAGAWHLTSSTAATPEDAKRLIGDAQWETYIDNENVLPDEQACLQRILQTHTRVQSGDHPAVDRTFYELVEACLNPVMLSALSPYSPDDAAAALGREGLKVTDGHLLIGNTAEGVKRILKDTPWASNWGTILLRLNGAEKGNSPAWFSGSGTMRYVSVPLSF